MTSPGFLSRALVRLALRAVPPPWRDDVAADIQEEAARPHAPRGAWWQARQAISVGLHLRRGRSRGPNDSRDAWRGPAAFGAAIRLLRRERLSTAAVAGALAIGIGTATTAHAVFNFALFRPVPGVADPASLVSIFTQVDHATPSRTAADHAHLVALRDRVPALVGVVAGENRELPLALDLDGPPQSANVTWTTRDYFQVLGVRPRIGRVFESDEYESASAPIAVISERMWERDFARAPDIVGHRIRVNAYPVTIVGVVRDFRGPQQLGRSDVWLPSGAIGAFSESAPDWTFLQNGIGRLRPGATLADAQAQALRAWEDAGPVRAGDKTFTPQLFAGITDGVGLTGSRLMAIYRVLMAGTALLLVLACANAANLMMARHARAAQNIALRSALGATRGRLLRELIAESAMIASAGGAGGLAIGAAALRLFGNARVLSYQPALEGLSIDWRVAVFAFGVAAATTLLFGVIPAVLASRTAVDAALKRASSRVTSSGRLRSVFVALQVALSFALVVGAAALTLTVRNLRAIDLGMNLDGVFAFSLRPRQIGYDDDASGRIVQETVARLRTVPGVVSVTSSWGTPLEQISSMRVRANGVETSVINQEIGDDYFRVLSIPVRAGRTFTASEVNATLAAASALPAVLNDKAARAIFGARPPVGGVLEATIGRSTATLQIIGVVANTGSLRVRDDLRPVLYLPIGVNFRNTTIAMKTSLSVADATRVVRAALLAVDPKVPAGAPRLLVKDLDDAMSEERLLSRVGVVVASAAALLAVAGLVASIVCFVTERTRELGLRLALGASRAAAQGFVLRRAVTVCGGGVAVGAAGVVLGGRWLAGRLYGVEAADPIVMAVAGAVLVAVALAAAWIPARRAGAIDAAITLRSE